MGVRSEDLVDMASFVGCNSGSFPFCYLGLKVGANMNRVVNWNSVYEIFDARLSSWKASLLSIGGRVTLIKSVLECLPNYYFSLYKAPSKVISDLEAKIRRFLWRGNEENKKLHWVAWNVVTLPKNKGGLGLSKLKNINVALLAKWEWRLKTENSKLWVKVVEAIHNMRLNWDFIPSRCSLGGVWCNIARVLYKQKVDEIPLRNFFRSKVGNGESTAFWLEPWLCNEPLKHKLPELFKLEKNMRCKVSERIKPVTVSNVLGHEFVWDWSRNVSAGVEVDELVDLYSRLIQVDLEVGPDQWEWIGAEDKHFSVGAVKRLLNSNGQHASLSLDPLEDCKWIPDKLNIFMWRSALNRIATVEALNHRNIQVQDDRCGFCNDGEDSADHIFSSCYVASVVLEPSNIQKNYQDCGLVHLESQEQKAVRKQGGSYRGRC
ncbi:putative reverse transcriptase zinc-binding domain-containing protein [Helianthus debilis subsp. tardiflorus]